MMKNKNYVLLIAFTFIWANILLAHPSPNTLVFLDIKTDGVAAELRLPVSELGVALNPTAPKKGEELLGNFADSLKIYLRNHITLIVVADGLNRIVAGGNGHAIEQASDLQPGVVIYAIADAVALAVWVV